ncbi:ras guanine nucleotide exchange factor domain-containing protein [Pilobolus umbonatus]|nr:ras guanine nucleotide exchange factor domain-containing protein [Pilobolus umbonatus]
MSHFVVDQLQENIRSMSIPSDTHQLLIKRMSSTLSLNELTRSLSHSSSSSRLKDSPTAPNLASLSKGSHRVVTHSESQPDMYSSYIKKRSSHFTKHPKKSSCRVEFAGGLINIDNAIISRKYSISSAPKPPSMTSTVTGTGWASSILGPQLLASSIISSFRHHQSEKDQANYHYKYFMKTTDNMIADQLTWIESELFMRIKPREFIRNIWTTGIDQHGSDPNIGRNSNTVSASISHFNFISAWVVTMILAQTRLSKRVLVLQKFMSIAVELRNLNNYNSLMAVLAGINSASILRLKQTRHAIASKKIFKQFQSLERLMSTDKSFSSYRMALKASGAPGIPYLGIHTQDLVSLAEANKDFRADGTIHWDKFRLMGETIMATMKFKCPRYNIEPDIKLMRFIADTSVLSEDEQYKRSILIEPRLGSSSTNRIRDLLLRL